MNYELPSPDPDPYPDPYPDPSPYPDPDPDPSPYPYPDPSPDLIIFPLLDCQDFLHSGICTGNDFADSMQVNFWDRWRELAAFRIVRAFEGETGECASMPPPKPSALQQTNLVLF